VRTSAGRLVGLLRWHFNIPSLSTPNPFDPRRRIEWSLNGDEWIKDVEGRRRPVFFDLDIGRFGVEVDDAEELISWLLDGYERESLAHELIAEAVRLGEDSPRSALVVAMTAAEVGVRSFVGSLGRADAAWLLSRPGAPPLDDLLKNYLPFVTDVRTRKGAVIPSELRRLVRRGVESRNKVVHFGEHGPDDVELEQLLTAVNDLLYILDWLAGEEWALEPVSDEWKDEYETKSDLR